MVDSAGKLATSVNVSFNPDEPDSEEAPEDLEKNFSFVLEEDKGGKDLFRPCSAYIQKVAGVEQMFSESGIVNVRLYSSKSATVKLYGDYGGGLTYLGKRSDSLHETLTFAGSKSQTLSKGYGIASGSIIEKTKFYYKDVGDSVKTKEEAEDEEFKAIGSGSPTQKGKGLFESSKEVYGAMMVSYSPSYYLFRVEYKIPDAVLLDMAETGKALSEYSLLPITVLAFAEGGYGATLSLSRNLGTQVESSECSGHWIEKSRIEKTERIYDDLEPENYIDFEKIIEVEQVCSNDPTITRIQRFNV